PAVPKAAPASDEPPAPPLPALAPTPPIDAPLVPADAPPLVPPWPPRAPSPQSPAPFAHASGASCSAVAHDSISRPIARSCTRFTPAANQSQHIPILAAVLPVCPQAVSESLLNTLHGPDAKQCTAVSVRAVALSTALDNHWQLAEQKAELAGC